jgi:hypothetical protein
VLVSAHIGCRSGQIRGQQRFSFYGDSFAQGFLLDSTIRVICSNIPLAVSG